MLKILIAEPKYSQAAKKILSGLGRVQECRPQPKQLLRIINKFDVLVVRLEVKVDKELIDKAKRLKIIATSTTGLDHIDTAYAEKKGIKVISLKGETDFLKEVWATAEHTFALLLSLIRKIPFAFEAVKAQKWQRDQFRGNELRDKTLGILGFGRLGLMVAEIAKGFGMKVLVCDPYVKKNKINRAGVRPVTLNKLLKEADVVTLHLTLSEKTVKLFSKKEFTQMKNSAFFINTARGQIVDEKALLSALKNKTITGAALDVMWQEDAAGKFLKNNPLLAYAKKNQNLIVTPHIAGTTQESLEKTQVFIAKEVKKYVRRNR